MSIVHELPPIHIPAAAASFAGFRSWANSPDYPVRGRISYIQGEIEVDMNADELHDHNPIKAAILVDLMNLIRLEKLGKVLADGVRLVNEQGEVISEPDLVFARHETIRAGKVRYVESADESGSVVEMEGTPDLVLEVVSKHSVRKDTVLLPRSYYEGGIPEYWLVTPQDQSVDFRLLVRGEDEYVPTSADADGYRFSPSFQRSFFLLRTPDEYGRWDYQLLWR